MEAHYHTQEKVPLIIGGLPDDERMTNRFALEIPSGLSILVGGKADTQVPGLDSVPRDQWPNVKLVHWSFDAMVGCGLAMLGVALWAGWVWWRKQPLKKSPWLLRAFLIASPLGFIALETGWMVTELGRQPWIVYNFMLTKDAVTPMDGLVVPFTVFTLVYLFLSVILVFLLKRQFLQTSSTVEVPPHAP
ncbi:MAG: Cytochrome bd oxidase subunit, partial [Prosthecobacter sp.]|nr:Cytochrome bd oxidase subunit [Prosthecobacter sp.]